jgi:hypothetical protein
VRGGGHACHQLRSCRLCLISSRDERNAVHPSDLAWNLGTFLSGDKCGAEGCDCWCGVPTAFLGGHKMITTVATGNCSDPYSFYESPQVSCSYWTI